MLLFLTVWKYEFYEDYRSMKNLKLTTTTFFAGFFFLISMALKSMPPATKYGKYHFDVHISAHGLPPVTYKLNSCSTIPCSFSISHL